MVKIWRGYQKKPSSNTCPIEDAPWVKGVEGHYWGCYGSVAKFNGKAKKEGDIAVHSLGQYLKKLIYFTDSNSTTVASSSTGILNALSKCINMKGNGVNLMFEFNKVFVSIVDDYANVAKPLGVHIGEDLVCSFRDALNKLGRVISNYMKEFIESCQLYGCRTKIDYECVLKELHKLMNIVALINETLLNKCENASKEVHEAVMVLDLLYFYMAISVQGIYSCTLDALNNRHIVVPRKLKSCSLSFEYALVELTKAICDVVLPSAKSITTLLTAFVNITLALNSTLKSTLGLVSGIELNVGQIAKNLLKDVTIDSAVTQERTNILKGVVRK